MTPVKYDVVGHRGFPQKYPENSLPGLIAAVEAGADCLELDVQVSRDGTLVVFHDETLERVTRKRGYVWDYSVEELMNISCHEPQRFSDRFNPTPISTLRQVCQALHQFDGEVFIEVKEQSLERVDRLSVFEKLQKDSLALSRYSVISFDYDILKMAKGHVPIGWVLHAVDDASMKLAYELSPDILITDVKKVDKNRPLWNGSWDWFLYDIVDPKMADQWHALGVRYIETWDVEALINQ